MFCFVMIPKINYYEYHPFSIASGPNEDHLTFYIKAAGDWTEKLQAITKQQAAEKGQETAGHSEISLYLEGPYGNLSIDVFDAETYPVAIMISGGVGITPMLGMLKHCLHLSLNGNTSFAESMSRVIFVWVFRDKAFADKLFQDCFSPLIEEHLVLQGSEGSNVYSLKAAGGKGISFEFHFHVTERLVGANPNSSKQLQTVGASTIVATSVEMVAMENASGNIGDVQASDNVMASTSPSSSGTCLGTHWKKGRPDFEAIFANAAKAVEDKRAKDGATKTCCCPSRVSVSACGPSPLIHNVRSQVRSSSYSTGVTFDLHEELFYL
jgi:hypothetical protein